MKSSKGIIIAVPLAAGLLAHGRDGFLSVVGFPRGDDPAYGIELMPCAALLCVDAALFLFGALFKHHILLHRFFPPL